MLIQFTRDFQSAATSEVFYKLGEIVELEQGAAIIAEGAAVAVPEPEPDPEPKPKVKR